MFLTKISVLNFRNHENEVFQFTKKLNCIIGPNGVGKTNLLDAIYYLCLTKSYFNSSDVHNIQTGKDFFRLDGKIKLLSDTHNIVYKLQQGRKKEVSVNDVIYSKLSEHIGKFPAIIIAPDDNLLVLGGSEERRKFLDNTISQINRNYLEWLIVYNKILAQRNAALKQFAESGIVNKELLDTYDEQLADLGGKIYSTRKIILGNLLSMFNMFYPAISLEREEVNFEYASQLHGEDFYALLKKGLKRDIILQRTDTGIHKDDIEFFIDGSKLKRFGSQGQQKSFIVALKLAQYRLINQNSLHKPLLLIDDIFDKLDIERSRQLVGIILTEDFGQVFITDTNIEQITRLLKGEEGKYDLIKFELKENAPQ